MSMPMPDSTTCDRDRTQLILAHVGLAVSVARRYQEGRGICLDDLVQEGILGLIRASQDFEPAAGRFRDYALPWVRGFIRRAVHQALDGGVTLLGAGDTQVPDRSAELAGSSDPRPGLMALAVEYLHPVEAWALRRRYGLDGGRSATLAEMATECGLSSHRIKQILVQALDRIHEILRQLEAA